MSIKNYEISNNPDSKLKINVYQIAKDRDYFGDEVYLNTYSTSSTVQFINEKDNSISNYKEINDNSTINNIVYYWKNRNYGKIYDISSNNKFFLLDENDNLQSITPFNTTWIKENNKYDYFNIPMNIFVPKHSENTPQCDKDDGLQEINTNIKMINNFYTNKFIPTTIKYTYSNKCNTLPLNDYEVISETTELNEYSTDHDIFVPGAIKKIERDKNKINVWYYKINNLFANSYTNDIITISTPTNINLYQAKNDGSLTKKNVNLPYNLPIVAANPSSFLEKASNLPPSLPNQNHYGLYSYADDNKLKLTCKDNDFLAGYSLTYKNDKYIIKPYCIHYSTTKVEDNQPPLQTNCKREEYLGHVYEETVPGTDFVIKDDNNEIYRHCYDGKWDEPKYTNNCGVIDGEIWEGGEERTIIDDNGNKYNYICKADNDMFIPTLIYGKCSTDNGEYNIGESYSTSCAIGEKGVKYYKCDEDGMKEINNCVKVCTHDNKEYNIGEFYSSSCNVGEKGSKIYACDNNGEWKLINGCKNTDGTTSTNTDGSTTTDGSTSTSTNTETTTNTPTIDESTTEEETADNNMIIIILIVIGILILFIILIIVIISSKVKRNKKKNSN